MKGASSDAPFVVFSTIISAVLCGGRGLPQGERSIPLFILPLDEENSRKVKQLIGGSQGQRVYDSDGLAITQCGGSGCMVENKSVSD